MALNAQKRNFTLFNNRVTLRLEHIYVFFGFTPGWVGDSLVTTAELFVRKLEIKP